MLAEPLLDGQGKTSLERSVSITVHSQLDRQQQQQQHDSLSRRVHNISFVVNVLLLLAKTAVFAESGSMAVLAALLDSVIDILAQLLLLFAQRVVSAHRMGHSSNTLYPAGQSRLEPMGVVACAMLMALASVAVIKEAAEQLWKQDARPLSLSAFDVAGLLAAIGAKLGLLVWCRLAAARTGNVTVAALGQDALNDILSNSAALLAAVVTRLSPALWPADPIGAIIIGVYIICNWIFTGIEQLEMIVGKSADEEFLEQLREIAVSHDKNTRLDKISAYHFGPRFLVEVEIVMPEDTLLRRSHDCGIALQHKLETLEEVERAFVHVDYMHRPEDDHDPGTPLSNKTHPGGEVLETWPSRDA